ncbi:MAG: anthranilate synthase [Microbacteriaceae bacterium BACL25 MAG-120322-bin65]|jgi:anthranilate synthase component I|nr:MAG: anthranilate synthase [Microbacteriaceae bacterium BACL25 MAG-120322-bin65]
MSDTSLEDFLAQGKTRRVVPVVRRVFADSETPMGLYRKLASGPGSFLLESADQAGKWSRYSFLGVSVHGVLTVDNGRARWINRGMSEEVAFGEKVPRKPLAALHMLNDRWLSDPVEGLPPFGGGLVGHLGWEMVRELETLPNQPPSSHEVPAIYMSLVQDFVAFDHHTSEVVMVAQVHAYDGVSAEDYALAVKRLDLLHADVSKPSASTLHQRHEPAEDVLTPSHDQAVFLEMVAKAKKHIIDGDVFQVVLSQQFELPVTASALEVYRVLRSVNPSPYMYLIECDDASGAPYQVVGSSPEALVTVSGGHVVSHPIAGSRPRGASVEEDRANAHSMASDDKEKAEHLMLVDLARNDLSKVTVAGSVEVTQFMEVERFSHIMHLVSSVEGTLNDTASAVDVFEATFPAGTLSGAPKPRALEIIDDLEPLQRGVYGGVVGYFGHSGDADLAITIRTVWMQNGVAIVQAGAGIVADSDPEAEYMETIHKASAPARAIRLANALEPDMR